MRDSSSAIESARRKRVLSRTVRDFGKELLEAARGGNTVTYGHLMKKFGLSRGRGISAVLSDVDRAQRLKGAPGFAAIIVRKDTGYPGGGYFCDSDLPVQLRRPASRRTDPRLSAQEREHIKRERRKIWGFYGKGNAVRTTT